MPVPVVAALQSFMNSFSLVDCALLLVFCPLLTLVHELGHATVPLLRTEGFVLVQVGREPGRLQIRLGRLIVRFDPLPSETKAAGYARVAARLSARERAAFAVAGPTCGALFSVARIFIGRSADRPFFEIAGWLGVALSLFGLIPHRVGRLRSDGWHLLQAIGGRGTGQSDARDNAARVEFLLANSSRYLTERRKQVLGGVPVLLGLAPDKPTEEGFLLCRLAFVGWCWRECERNPAQIRESALDALQQATRTGAVEPALTGHAAQLLAESDAEFGVAFEEGFTYSHRPGDGDRERFAFRFGGALREIERIRA